MQKEYTGVPAVVQVGEESDCSGLGLRSLQRSGDSIFGPETSLCLQCDR